MQSHINESIIDYSNSFIYMGLAQGSCAQKEFQIYVISHRLVTYGERNPPMDSHEPLTTWSCMVM